MVLTGKDKISKFITVTQLTKYLKNLIETDDFLRSVWVKGEISGLKKAPSGHVYFTLKDPYSQIRCVMFASIAGLMKFNLEDGMKVLITGNVTIYEKTSHYQIKVQDLKPEGIGELFLAFQQLKEKLSKEGLFDERHKKPLPYFPLTIGVVTSPTGAVIHDIITTLKKRNDSVKIILAPAQVQGIEAPLSVVKALDKLNRLGGIDLIILARGGGSIEELMAFNTEIVARAIFESKIPIISAVGHETDFTITDFVADYRAPTPTGAAQTAIFDKIEQIKSLETTKQRFKLALLSQLEIASKHLDNLRNSFVFKNPYQKINTLSQDLDRLAEIISSKIKDYFQKKREKLKFLENHLKVLNPLSILQRGYSICFDSKNQIIKSISQIAKGDKITVKVANGDFKSKVIK